MTIQPQYLDAIREIYTRLQDHQVNWVITGSLGMALQGMDVEIHDIDIQTDKDGAFQVDRCFPEYVIKPVRYAKSERICSYLGMLEIMGIQVEIMGDIQKKLEDQTWEEPVKVELYRRWVEVAGMRLPVLSLEYEYQAYLKLNRNTKAEMIRDWLEKTKAG